MLNKVEDDSQSADASEKPSEQSAVQDSKPKDELENIRKCSKKNRKTNT